MRSAIAERLVRCMRPSLVAAVFVLLLVAPTLALGVFARSVIEKDLATQDAAERLRYARLGASLVDQSLVAVGRQLDVFVTRQLLQEALRKGDAAALARHLASLRAPANGYAIVGALDSRGASIVSDPAQPQLVGQSFAERDYFRGAMATESWYVSDVFSSALAGSPTFVVVARAVRAGPEVLGLVVVALSPARVLSALDPLLGVSGREIVLVDKGARVVASSDPQRVPLSTLDLPPGGVSGGSEAGEVMAAVAGVDRLLTYAPVRSAAWALYVIDDPAVVFATQRALGATVVLAALAAAVLVAAFGAAIAVLLATRERQRRALAAVNAELAVASRHKSEFLSNMSHELRTPLNAVLGFSELLREQLGATLTDRQRRYLQNIHDAGAHLLALINEVLDLAKVEAGHMELSPEVLRLGTLLEPTLAAARVAATARGIALATEFPADARVRVDPGRARQILYNLLSNAVKFTPEGGRVTLRAHTDDSALHVEVADTGIGIPADKRDRVFGTFERLHEGRSEASGTGLGLALTKRLVEAHGGSIDFESGDGSGTTFRVALPDAVVPQAQEDYLLVVEDEARDADLIVALAAQVGLPCEVAGTADEALAAAREGRPLGVVLDLRLPDRRGEEVLRRLKADPATSRIPVVVVTVEDERAELRAQGADDYLVKPLDRPRLLGWLRQLAARKAARDAVAAR